MLFHDIEDHRVFAQYNRKVEREIPKLKNGTWRKMCGKLENLGCRSMDNYQKLEEEQQKM